MSAITTRHECAVGCEIVDGKLVCASVSRRSDGTIFVYRDTRDFGDHPVRTWNARIEFDGGDTTETEDGTDAD